MTAEPLQEPTRAEEVRGVLRLLSYAEGFTLAFVECNLAVERERLVEELVGALKERGLRGRELVLDGPEDDLLEQIQTLDPPPQAGDVILVRGLERSIPSKESIPHTLDRLNLDRELFRELPCPVVLVLPEYAITKISREAPDFWAWRSGVFLAGPSKERLEHLGPSLMLSTGSRFMSLSGAQKRKRVEVLQELVEASSQQGLGNRAIILDMYGELVTLLRFLGQWPEIESAAHRYLEMARKLGNQEHEAYALENLGLWARHRGHHEEAVDFLQDASSIAETSGDPDLLTRTYQTIGSTLVDWGELERAEGYLRKALHMSRRSSNPAGQATAYLDLAKLAMHRTELQAAEEWLDRAKKIAEQEEDRRLLADTALGKTLLLLRREQGAAATEAAKKSSELASVMGEKRLEIEALQFLAAGHWMLGDPAEAAAALARAIRIEKELGVPASHNSAQLLATLTQGLGEEEARRRLAEHLDPDVLEDAFQAQREASTETVGP